MQSNDIKREQSMLRGYDPLREEAHWKLICYGVSLGLLTAVWWYSAVQHAHSLEKTALNLSYTMADGSPIFSTPSSVVDGLIWLFLIPVCLIVGEVIIFLRSRKARARILHLRMTALAGTAPLCSLPSLAPLPIILPYTIHMSIKNGFFGRYRSFLLGIVLAVAFSMFVGGSNVNIFEQLQSWISVATTPIYVFLLFVPIWFIWTCVVAHWGSPTLTLNDAFIIAYYRSGHVMMHWANVRFFAITGESGRGRKVAFELSDGEHIIRWFDDSTIANFDRYAPIMEPAQYVALMQTLPHWICSKTNLPLYDLRNY